MISILCSALLCPAASCFRFYTIVGVRWFNFCVRDDYRCFPAAIATVLFMDLSKTNISFNTQNYNLANTEYLPLLSLLLQAQS